MVLRKKLARKEAMNGWKKKPQNETRQTERGGENLGSYVHKCLELRAGKKRKRRKITCDWPQQDQGKDINCKGKKRE